MLRGEAPKGLRPSLFLSGRTAYAFAPLGWPMLRGRSTERHFALHCFCLVARRRHAVASDPSLRSAGRCSGAKRRKDFALHCFCLVARLTPSLRSAGRCYGAKHRKAFRPSLFWSRRTGAERSTINQARLACALQGFRSCGETVSPSASRVAAARKADPQSRAEISTTCGTP